MTSATGLPVVAGPDGYLALTPIRIDKSSPHDERWLQQLIFEHPRALPVADIEPGFGDLIPIAMEITCAQGRIDNLYLTPRGDVVVVETKLWVNAEARRHVVAQTLDYAAALSSMGYEAFEGAVLRSELRIPAKSVYELVADHPEALAEERFIDAVASNLRRGRMLMLAVGDGIREESRALADLLESHAGAHFTFALIELKPYRLGNTDELLIVPATLLRTTIIERGIVVIDDTRTYVKPASRAQVGPSARGQTLSEIEFFELMAARDPRLPSGLRRFLGELETIHGEYEVARSLRLRIENDALPRGGSLGYIDRHGRLWTDTVALNLPLDPALRYLQQLAELVGGQLAFSGEKRTPSVVLSGGSAPSIDRLIPDHIDGWLAAIRELDEALVLADE